MEFFGLCALTKNLDLGQRQALAKVAGLLSVKPQGVVFWEGSKDTKMYFVLRGKVVVSKSIKGNIEEVLAHFGPGEYFGEIALVDEAPRSATVQAQTEAVLISLERNRLQELEKSAPQLVSMLYKAMLRDMVGRLRQTNEKLLATVLWGMQATSLGEKEINE